MKRCFIQCIEFVPPPQCFRFHSNLPLQAKNDSTSRTALIALQGDKKSKRDLSKDPFAVERCCGGNYTSFMQNPRKQLKGSTNQKDSGTFTESQEWLTKVLGAQR